jgi:hypothetical protein
MSAAAGGTGVGAVFVAGCAETTAALTNSKSSENNRDKVPVAIVFMDFLMIKSRLKTAKRKYNRSIGAFELT